MNENSNERDRASPGDQDVAGRSTSDTIAREFIRGLYSGDYEPGQRLYEADLTKRYAVSRGPVREALNKLAATGIVDLTMQRGARVKLLNVDEALDTLVVAQALVSLAARLAALNIDRPGARSQMEKAAQNLSGFDASSPNADFAWARSNFYAALAGIANNAELRLIFPGVRIHLIRVQFRAFLKKIDARRHSDYRRIADAVLSGREAEAESAARVHFGRAIEALRECRGS